MQEGPRAQRRGGKAGLIRPGDRVFFEPGEEINPWILWRLRRTDGTSSARPSTPTTRSGFDRLERALSVHDDPTRRIGTADVPVGRGLGGRLGQRCVGRPSADHLNINWPVLVIAGEREPEAVRDIFRASRNGGDVRLSYLATITGMSVREIEDTYFRWLTRTDEQLCDAFDAYDAAVSL
jgi:hypothetical protein